MSSAVLISVSGKNASYFVKRLILKGIAYKNLRCVNRNKIILKISYDDYQKIIKETSIYDLKIIKYYGEIKYQVLFSFYKPFFYGLILGIIVVLIMSNMIFEIDIIHADKKIRELIYDELSDNGVKVLSFIPNYDKKEKIKTRILNNHKNEIEWLEIDCKGSKIIVKVTERRINKKEDAISNRDIVAKKNGIIMLIEAQQGDVIKKKNDYVNKGDVIITGNIIKDETIKGQVAAKGKVYAEVWYKVNVTYPLYYHEENYLNEVKTNYIMHFFNHFYKLKKNYTNSFLEKKKVLVSEKVILFEIYKERQRKMVVKVQKLTTKQATYKALEEAEKKITSRLSKDEYVISKKALNFSVNNSKIVVDVFFKVYENITAYQNIQNAPAPIKEEESD